ncbi:MAG: hypothetical protein P4L65_01420 [Legionella sp.]|nr:hypothetical protein [Legionella sp.]
MMDKRISSSRKKAIKPAFNKLKATAKKSHRKEEELELDRDLESTFPASDAITKY